MDPLQYIQSIAANKPLLQQVIVCAKEALKAIDAREKEAELKKELAKLHVIKQAMYATTWVSTRAAIENAMEQEAAECRADTGEEPTVAHTFEQAFNNTRKSIKAALYAYYCDTVPTSKKWRQRTMRLKGADIVDWGCSADECWYADNQDRMSTEMPIRESRWSAGLFYCDVCFDNCEVREIDIIVLKRIKNKLLNGFYDYARAHLTVAPPSKRIKN
jgi:hypothetical protein